VDEDKGRHGGAAARPAARVEAAFLEQVLPRLRPPRFRRSYVPPRAPRDRLGESHVEERIRPNLHALSARQHNILAAPGEVQIHLPRLDDNRTQAEPLDELCAALSWTRRPHFRPQGRALEDVVAELLTTNRATISTAESCTGGLLAEALPIPGKLYYFLGGVVSYSNERKTVWTEVPAEQSSAFQRRGSAELAIALAEGIRRSVGSTFGVGITVSPARVAAARKNVGHGAHCAGDSGGNKRAAGTSPGDREMISLPRIATCADMVRVHYSSTANRSRAA